MQPSGEIARLTAETLYLVLLLSAPVLVVSLVVGLSVGLMQAMTQVHEQTLSFVPKLVGVGLVLTLAGGWMTAEMVRFSGSLLQAIPELVP